MRKKRTVRPEFDFKEYEKHLSPDEKAWIRQFNKEYYYAPANAEKVIITDEEGQKEAHRVHNGMFTDIYSIAERSGGLSELSPDKESFMQDASDEHDVMNVYKQQGYENAIREVFYQAERDLCNKTIPVLLTLARFLNKFLSLKRTHNRRGDNK
jgi:hypothetical protein